MIQDRLRRALANFKANGLIDWNPTHGIECKCAICDVLWSDLEETFDRMSYDSQLEPVRPSRTFNTVDAAKY